MWGAFFFDTVVAPESRPLGLLIGSLKERLAAITQANLQLLQNAAVELAVGGADVTPSSWWRGGLSG